MSGTTSETAGRGPIGAARIAFSHLAVLLGLVAAGIFLALWGLFTDTVCGQASDVVCGLGWLWSGGLVGVLGGTAITAAVFKLGWEWWAGIAAVMLALPALSVLPDPVPIGVCVLAPATAGALTWSGTRERPRWRPWLMIGLIVLATAASAVSVLV
ncbi:MAG: hypothetical protein ACK5LS_09615 [Propioniciclava sp.]